MDSSFALAIIPGFSALSRMGFSNQPVTLTPEQVEDLSRKLSLMRHDINNMLSLMTAAVELIRSKPQMTERMVETALEQPSRIVGRIGQFSTEFEHALGLAHS